MQIDRKKYVLFGTGDYYNRFSHWFADKNVLAILDNDEKKQGTLLDGHPVVSPKDITKYDYDAIVILSFYISEMKKQLLEFGVDEAKIFHFYDLHELLKDDYALTHNKGKSILLLSHDLSLGGPALALYHAAVTLKKAGYEVLYASMLDGELRKKLEDSFIPVIVDNRLQVSTMNEIDWTKKFDMLICNTINYHIFLSDRDINIPVIWWLHDSPFFYAGIKEGRLSGMDKTNLKLLSVGPVPRDAMNIYCPDVVIDDLLYGVADGI